MSESLLYNPDLPFIHTEAKGNRYHKGKFTGYDNELPVSFRQVFRWMVRGNPQRKEKKQDQFRLSRVRDERIFTEQANAFCWLGHSAFLFRINGKLILTDPCLYSLPGIKRLVESPFATHEIKNIDLILFTHAHRDHFDKRSVKELLKNNAGVPVFAPLKMAELIRQQGSCTVTEAAWFQRFPEIIPGLTIDFLPAKHWNRRLLRDTNRMLWGSFMLQWNDRKIYFAGDTAMADHFSRIGRHYDNIDHVFMPIAAYKPDYIMQNAHINPDEAAEAFRQLGGKYFVPMHYATYDLSDEPISEPIRRMENLMHHGSPDTPLLAPAVGEYILL